MLINFFKFKKEKQPYKLQIIFEKNKVKIKLNWQIIYFKNRLSFDERQKFYFLKENRDFLNFVLKNYKSSNLKQKIENYIQNFQIPYHIIQTIIDKLYQTKDLFDEKEQQIEHSINNFIKKVKETIIDNKNNYFKLDSFITNNILSDIYWTTTMEWWQISIQEIKNKIWENYLLLKEAENIEKALNFISQLIKEKQFNWFLSLELIKQIHKIATQWLDNLNHNWLNYNPWTFRKEKILMWIFPWKKEKYIPPENPIWYLENFIDIFNQTIKEQWKIKITDIAIFHLVFYAIHPFYNWNKRTTRIIESWLIQYQFDKYHFLKWMWYWFRKNINSYFDIIRKILGWIAEPWEWLKYYLNEFENMVKYSEVSFEVSKNFDISKYISSKRKHLYTEKDIAIIKYMLILKNLWKNQITSQILLDYLLEQGLVKFNQLKQYKKKFNEKLHKYEKDWLIKNTWKKEWKYTVYEIRIK